MPRPHPGNAGYDAQGNVTGAATAACLTSATARASLAYAGEDAKVPERAGPTVADDAGDVVPAWRVALRRVRVDGAVGPQCRRRQGWRSLPDVCQDRAGYC